MPIQRITGTPDINWMFSNWLDWTPQLYQNGNVTSTVNFAKYLIVGNTIIWTFGISATAAGSSGQSICIRSLPWTFSTSRTVGSFYYLDQGSSYYAGTALYVVGDPGLRFITTSAGGYLGTNPAFAVASSDSLSAQGIVPLP
jgi:hypothetical protein